MSGAVWLKGAFATTSLRHVLRIRTLLQTSRLVLQAGRCMLRRASKGLLGQLVASKVHGSLRRSPYCSRQGPPEESRHPLVGQNAFEHAASCQYLQNHQICRYYCKMCSVEPTGF